MEFGDVVACVATLAVIFALISFPLELVLIPALDVDWGPIVSSAISMLLAALIGGYIFAGKIWEARMEAVAKITVLSAVLVIFFVLNLPGLANWNTVVHEAYPEPYPGGLETSTEWYVVESMALGQQVFINVVMVLLLGFAGLYVGSMLRQPAKS